MKTITTEMINKCAIEIKEKGIWYSSVKKKYSGNPIKNREEETRYPENRSWASKSRSTIKNRFCREIYTNVKSLFWIFILFCEL